MFGVVELGDVAQSLRIAAKVDYRSLPHGALGDVVADIQELKAQLASLEADVLAGGIDPHPVSGGQERLENLVNQRIWAVDRADRS